MRKVLKKYWINKTMTIKAKTYLLKCTRLEKVLCLVSDLFAIAENIRVNKLKVSEMGKEYDILRILCHTEKKEGTQIFPRFF